MIAAVIVRQGFDVQLGEGLNAGTLTYGAEAGPRLGQARSRAPACGVAGPVATGVAIGQDRSEEGGL